MIKIITVIGARPQIIKAAALSRAIGSHFKNEITEIIVHTGQHYDENMSAVFFKELGIPEPNYNLNCGSGTHGNQTAAMMIGIEEILLKEKPNAIVLYGDTNSTLAGAIAASKVHVPIVHIEAGLRSHSKVMPEEVNRILCDHVSTLLFSPTKTGYNNLLKEGFSENNMQPFNADNPKIYHCGDVMFDNSIFFSKLADSKNELLNKYNLQKNNFILATIHRNNNTDDKERLNSIFRALSAICDNHNTKVFLPLHPRTNKILESNLESELYQKITTEKKIILAPPASFLEMILLEKSASIVMTDSGGVQKEAFYFEKPCVIIRPETEWVELVECGTAIVADADEKRIISAYETLINKKDLKFPKIYGDGNAAEFICKEMVSHIS